MNHVDPDHANFDPAVPAMPDPVAGWLGAIRQMWSGEEAPHGEHLLRLDAESRHDRFAGSVSDAFIRSYADPRSHPGRVLYGFFPDGTLRGVAELQPLGGPFAKEAEAAISIEAPWRGHGIGTALVGRLLLGAGNRGLKGVRINYLSGNEAMRHLARRFGGALSFQPGGGVVGEFHPAHLSPMSMMQEIVADELGLFGTVLDAHADTIRRILTGSHGNHRRAKA